MQELHSKEDVFTMSEKWMQDMAKSSAVIKQALPILRDMLNDRKLNLMPVEGKEEEVCKMLDKTCGIDYFVLRSDSETFGVAWRCQWVEPGKEYNSFTVRKSRETGAATEFEKRKNAVKNKSIYPYYVCQAFVNMYTNEIISLGLTTTETELDYIVNPITIKEIRHTGKEQDGQAEFYVLYWCDMRVFGYDVIVYKQNIGLT